MQSIRFYKKFRETSFHVKLKIYTLHFLNGTKNVGASGWKWNVNFQRSRTSQQDFSSLYFLVGIPQYRYQHNVKNEFFNIRFSYSVERNATVVSVCTTIP